MSGGTTDSLAYQRQNFITLDLARWTAGSFLTPAGSAQALRFRRRLLEVVLVRKENHVLARWKRRGSLLHRRFRRFEQEDASGHSDDFSGGHIHRLGLAGNVVALAALVLACTNSDLLLNERRGSMPPIDSGREPTTEAADGSGEQLVLVVIDGLRADTAFDRQQMPFLSRLADRHGRATARVESLIPSSIAGIATITTGNVPPPISFLSDFGAGAARHGGMLQAVAAVGGRSFVAGPKLWTDLYGRWIAAAELDTTFGRRDERLTTAALAAIDSGQYRLVVLHLGRVDAAAHHFGIASAEHAAAASACDRAIREIHTALPPNTGLIVTSDHGNTQFGGHAGPEPAVVTTPLVVAARHRPAMPGEVSQSQLAGLIAEKLGVTPYMPVDEQTWFSSSLSSSTKIGMMAVVTLGGLALCSATSGRSSGSRQAFALNSAVWVSLGLSLLGYVGTALLVGVAVLAAVALATGIRISPAMIGCCIIGAVVGGLRLSDGAAGLDDVQPPGLALSGHAVTFAAPVAFAIGQAPLAAVFLLSVAGGKGLQAWSRLTGSHAVTGAALVGTYIMLSRVLGETVSLSSVDVRSGFCLVHLPSGLLLACLLVLAGQVIPAAGLLLGSRAALMHLSGQDFGKLVSAAAAMLLGQLLIVACLFASTATNQTMQSLGLGLLARVIAECSYFFISFSGILLFSWLGAQENRRAASHPAAGGRCSTDDTNQQRSDGWRLPTRKPTHLPLSGRACYNLRAHRGL